MLIPRWSASRLIAAPGATGVTFTARLSGGDTRRRPVRRTGRISPYTVDAIVDEAMRFGAGGELHLLLDQPLASGVRGWLDDRLAILARNGVTARVAVEAERPPCIPARPLLRLVDRVRRTPMSC